MDARWTSDMDEVDLWTRRGSFVHREHQVRDVPCGLVAQHEHLSSTGGLASHLRPMLFSPAEAAEALSLSRATIYRLFDQGRLGSVWVGASRRIQATELDRFVAEIEANSPNMPARFPGHGSRG